MMKRFAPTRRLVATLVAGLCLMVGAARAADTVSNDKRLPQDTLIYFTVNNVNEFKEKFGSTQFGKLLKDDSMADFLAQFEEPLKAISSEVEDKTGVGLTDILSIPSGEVSFAVSYSDGQPVSIILMLDYGDSQETVEKLIKKATEAAEEEGGKSSEEEVDGVKVITLTPPGEESEDKEKSDDAPAAGIEESFKSVSYAMKDSTLMISNQVSAITGLLTRWDGSSDSSLATAASYKLIMSKVAPKGDDPSEAGWYIDLMGLIQAGITLGSAENPQVGMAAGFLPVLGLDQLKGFGGAMNVGEGDFDNVTRSFIHVEQPPRGALRLFSMPAVEQTPAKWVHDNCSMFFSMNCDLQDAYKGVEGVVNTFMGEGYLAKMIEDFAESEDGPKIHIKKDIIDQITGKITVSSDVEEDDEGSQERYVVAVELTNEAAFKKILAKAAKFPGFPAKAREFEGSTIYELGLDGVMEEEEESEEQSFRNLADEEGKEGDDEEKEGEDDDEMEEEEMTPALAIGRKHLFFGTDVEQIEQILRGKDEDSLAESKIFKQVSKYFPKKVSSMSYQRADAQVKGALKALKSGQLDSVVGDNIDLSKLPDFDDIKQYFTPTGGYVRPDEDGVFMENFNLKSE